MVGTFTFELGGVKAPLLTVFFSLSVGTKSQYLRKYQKLIGATFNCNINRVFLFIPTNILTQNSANLEKEGCAKRSK